MGNVGLVTGLMVHHHPSVQRCPASGTTLVVNELMAATKEANTALWRFCFDTDLISCTEALRRPVDDPLPWMLADPRRLQRSTRDGLWVRIIDVSASLKLRRYMQSDRLVLEVQDGLCPWNEGRFELEGSSEAATCRASSSSPDLVLSNYLKTGGSTGGDTRLGRRPVGAGPGSWPGFPRSNQLSWK